MLSRSLNVFRALLENDIIISLLMANLCAVAYGNINGKSPIKRRKKKKKANGNINFKAIQLLDFVTLQLD